MGLSLPRQKFQDLQVLDEQVQKPANTDKHMQPDKQTSMIDE